MFILIYDDKRGELKRFAAESMAIEYLKSRGFKYKSWVPSFGEVWHHPNGDILFLTLSED